MILRGGLTEYVKSNRPPICNLRTRCEDRNISEIFSSIRVIVNSSFDTSKTVQKTFVDCRVNRRSEKLRWSSYLDPR